MQKRGQTAIDIANGSSSPWNALSKCTADIGRDKLKSVRASNSPGDGHRIAIESRNEKIRTKVRGPLHKVHGGHAIC